MKYFLLVLLMSFTVQGAQINLDCFDNEGVKVASIYTPTFVYSNFQLKMDLEMEKANISFDVPFQTSIELPGVYFSRSENLTIVGVSSQSPFALDASMELSILKDGLLVNSLNCVTTVNNPAFPR